MKDEITATEAKMNFGELFAEVSVGKRHIKVKKHKKKGLVMIPLDAYEEYLLLKLQERQKTRRELVQEVRDFTKNIPPLKPGEPDAVQIIREIRDNARF